MRIILSLVFAFCVSAGGAAERPNVTAAEIKLGQTMPYSGPASGFSVQGQVQQAYFKAINKTGGINGRLVNLISLDDAYSPAKAIEQTRKLVEQDEVLAIYGTVGTPTNAATQKYLNGKRVPQLFIASGASRFNNPKQFPWTVPFYASLETEGRILGQFILKNKPTAKIAILSQNDDFGRDYVRGFKDGLGEGASRMVVGEAFYDVTDPTVDSQLLNLKATGADVYFNVTTPKFAAQAIRKVSEIGWRPLFLTVSIASSMSSVLIPAGIEKAEGIVTAVYFKQPGDPEWSNDDDMKTYVEFMTSSGMEKYITDGNAVFAYMSALLMHKILERCGEDLSRKNLMRLVTSIDEKSFALVQPGIEARTTADDVAPFHALRIQRFEGGKWKMIDGIYHD